MIRIVLALSAASLTLAGCQQSGAEAGGQATSSASDRSTEPYAGVNEGETIRFTGTEPFWGGEVTGDELRYTTPENQEGAVIAVERFAGNNGVAYSGVLNGSAFDMTVTPGQCSDGMSDRMYPFTVTLKIADETRGGCAWTDRMRFTGPENP